MATCKQCMYVLYLRPHDSIKRMIMRTRNANFCEALQGLSFSLFIQSISRARTRSGTKMRKLGNLGMRLRVARGENVNLS